MEINYNIILSKYFEALKTLKVFSFFNLKIEIGKILLPEIRAFCTKRHNPNLASQTAKVKKIKIKIELIFKVCKDRVRDKKIVNVKISNLNRTIKIWLYLKITFIINNPNNPIVNTMGESLILNLHSKIYRRNKKIKIFPL